MRVRLAATTLAIVAAAPTSAYAIDYLSADQAAKLIFPDADRFEPRELTLAAAQMQQLDAQGVKARSAHWSLRAARRGDSTLGYVVVDEVIGKVELITYAVGLAASGEVKQIEILSYRESHGFEVRLPAWRKQFVGKDASAPLRVGDDIANISGATLSCSHVTEGVRRIVAVIDLARHLGTLT